MASQEKNKYSLAFKRQVVQEYERGATFAAWQRKYGIPQGPTIRRWLTQFSPHPGEPATMTNGNTTETDEIQVQQAERIAALEKLVARLSLDKLMLESTITVLDERLAAWRNRFCEGGNLSLFLSPVPRRGTPLRFAGGEGG